MSDVSGQLRHAISAVELEEQVSQSSGEVETQIKAFGMVAGQGKVEETGRQLGRKNLLDQSRDTCGFDPVRWQQQHFGRIDSGRSSKTAMKFRAFPSYDFAHRHALFKTFSAA